MRDFHIPGRSAAYGTNGMAATSHPLATTTALEVLRQGGNAVDAAVAAVAALCVVEPAMTGIGGDCFVLYAPASGGVVALNGSGRAPAAATPERLAELGVTALGSGSPHSVTIPGAIAAWEKLVEAHGSRSLGELLQPAIRYAEEGFPVSPRVALDWKRCTPTLERSAGGRSIYLPGGKAPGVGRIVRLPTLARTLRRVAEGGAQAFYTGEIAEAMATTLQSMGGLQGYEDFAAAEAEFVEPIQTSYRDVRVYQCPPNGQGVITLLMLNILEGYDMASLDPNGAERHHLLAEAAKLAYRDRDLFLADPAHASSPMETLIEKSYAGRLREQIDRERAMTDLPPPLLDAHPDTTYLSVVDRDLNAVSFINSIYDGFGSGLVCERTGVIFHNRGRAFRLDPKHPNCIAPGKRPMHTIIPGLAFKGGEVWAAYGVMGGNYQPVGQSTVLSAMIDYGMDPQEAIDAPRSMAFPVDMEVERGMPAATRAGLQERGHQIVEPAGPLGGGQAIVIDRKRGVLIGGADPRKDSVALGL
ncbi:gamma-glutamyltransferase [Marinimicrococcus flavescens]|uniref:Glutathione hydrolase proenzyme n=1 Tax=Marinimicrococcus flavescens TaxID=3031815 RepID=A0AAP3V389_9PROT|nr:gamma-glutamyltransferase [Marinimicrococcus flavescens]